VAFENQIVNLIAADPGHPATYFAFLHSATPNAGPSIWKSTDRGETWTQISSLDAEHSPSQLVFDPSRPDTLYLGGGYGAAPLLRSSDGGRTWTELPGTSSVRRLTVTTAGTLAALSDQLGLSLSMDRGETWTPPLEGAPGVTPSPQDELAQVVGLSFPQGEDTLYGVDNSFEDSPCLDRSQIPSDRGKAQP
jgi:hypothetical protein